MFAGELLEGLEIARSPMFDAWITAERRRFRGIQAVLLENLSRALPHEAAAPYIDAVAASSRLSTAARMNCCSTALARQGRIAEGEAHLASGLQAVRSRRARQRAAAQALAQARESTCRAGSARARRSS